MSEHHYVACDLGADSGRVMLGCLKNGRLNLDEIHRFPNGPAKIGEALRWDILRIFEELKTGLRKVAERNVPVESMSVDSWGVDYVLYNWHQPMLTLPYHYRDTRTDKHYQAARKDFGDKIFAETGIQFLPFNTLYQLLDDIENNPGVLALADRFLVIADYLNYLFCGVARAEESLASTTQLYNTVSRQWSPELLRTFRLPEHTFPQIVPSGTKLGPLLPAIQVETGLRGIPVYATCSHDTGAAVAAVPAQGEGWAFLSSGTWSLIGAELPRPLVNERVRELNFTNEAGYGGTTRFLKNIVGLWILQESRREWMRQGERLDYDELDRLAEQAEPFRSLINPNDPRFMTPDAMPDKISDFCRKTGQPEPETPGQITRCILESLALSYRQMLGYLEELIGMPINRLHIVGGGTKSCLLNQFAANGTGRQVFAGPIEATACGNVLIQALAMNHLHSLHHLREVVSESFPIVAYCPQSTADWDKAFERFSKLTFTA